MEILIHKFHGAPLQAAIPSHSNLSDNDRKKIVLEAIRLAKYFLMFQQALKQALVEISEADPAIKKINFDEWRPMEGDPQAFTPLQPLPGLAAAHPLTYSTPKEYQLFNLFFDLLDEDYEGCVFFVSLSKNISKLSDLLGGDPLTDVFEGRLDNLILNNKDHYADLTILGEYSESYDSESYAFEPDLIECALMDYRDYTWRYDS